MIPYDVTDKQIFEQLAGKTIERVEVSDYKNNIHWVVLHCTDGTSVSVHAHNATPRAVITAGFDGDPSLGGFETKTREVVAPVFDFSEDIL